MKRVKALIAILLILTVAQVAQARELPTPPEPSGYYQMEPGEVFEARCTDNPDGVQPAVNVALVGGEWRLVLGCPEQVDQLDGRRDGR